jgi:hypothetical protein
MPAADARELIADARLVLEYAVRSGKLPGIALAEAIEQLEASNSARSIIDLQQAMNDVVPAIAPMTLVDLRAGRNPFDRRNVRARNRWQFGLSVATLVLIAIIANYQYSVQELSSALQAYNKVTDARGSERITDLRKLVQQGALAKDSCQRDSYQKARHELSQLARQTAMAKDTLLGLSTASAWPIVDWLHGIVISKASAAVPSPQTGAPIGYPGTGAVTAAGAGERADDPCAESRRSRQVPAGYPAWLRVVVLDTIDEFCFASKLSADQLTSVDPIRGSSAAYYGKDSGVNPVAVVEQRMRVYTGWLLPCLYGLLGACVYVMRRLLFDTRSAVVENVVVVLRLALGALAGVAIGWFVISGATPSAFVSASSFPYLCAFLAGFSIDILFTLIDRVSRLVIDKSQGTA